MKKSNELALYGGKKLLSFLNYIIYDHLFQKKIKIVNDYLKNENNYTNNGNPK